MGGGGREQKGELITIYTPVDFYEFGLFPDKNLSVALVRERTIPIERQPLVSEVSADFCA
jgi:hypothetical protein